VQAAAERPLTVAQIDDRLGILSARLRLLRPKGDERTIVKLQIDRLLERRHNATTGGEG
jgi:hypothetical protein